MPSHPPGTTPPATPTGVNRPEEARQVLERIAQNKVRFINLEFTDVVGLAKCVTIPAEQFSDCITHGKWFDGSAIEGFARAVESDMYLRPELGTFAEIPWRASEQQGDTTGVVARVICDVLTPAGERFDGNPRAVLVSALDHAARLGYRYEVSPELEFFLLTQRDGQPGDPLPHDRGGYFDLSTDLAAAVRAEIVAALARMNVRIETSHHEVAGGQHELDFAPTDALSAADAVITARQAVKAVAQRHGLWATFMPKPFFEKNGSGMHVHQQLIHLREGTNAFSDRGDAYYGLSALARHFVAGQLAHAAGMCAVLCPLVNSYKRLVPHFEAPSVINWGRVNREALIRVPRTAAGAPGSARVELRCADPSCNPYLAFAVMLHAGLDGMQRELPVPPPVEESVYPQGEPTRLPRQEGVLPATLGEALAALGADDVMRGALGELIADWFTEAKSREWAEYRRQVHQWELDRYMPMF